jgi:hypothetical protein
LVALSPTPRDDTHQSIGATQVTTQAAPDDQSKLLLSEQASADPNPAERYLAGRAPRSKGGVREALNAMAALLTAGEGTAQTIAWHLLRSGHVEHLRAMLIERYPARAASRMLAVLRGVLQQCWQLGLMPADEYQRAHTAATPETQAPRSGLRSVFESCDDGPPNVERGGAVRTLLYGNGAKQSRAISKIPGAQLSAPSVRGTAMSMEQLHLRRVAAREAIAHALWEAGVCLRSSAFCASLAMLRKALDLWSADYRERHGLDGDRGADEPGNLTWRLTKIAEENKLYHDTIRVVLESLNHEGLGPQAGVVCRGGYVSGYDGYAITRIKETYRNLHDLVVTLITATTPELPL